MPLPSLTVHTTPTGGPYGTNDGTVLTTVTAPQLSVAGGGVKVVVAPQTPNVGERGTGCAEHVMTGGVVSTLDTVTDCWQVAELLDASVAVQVTVRGPTANGGGDASLLLLNGPGQLSVIVGVDSERLHVSPLPGAGHVIPGGCWSTTVTT